MGLESFGKILGSFASTTAKKAGEQVQITKLSIDKAGLEKQIEGIYSAMGRYCHTKVKRGESVPEELLEYCRDVETLEREMAELDAQIAEHRQRRDEAVYRAEPEEEPDGVYAEAGEIPLTRSEVEARAFHPAVVSSEETAEPVVVQSEAQSRRPDGVSPTGGSELPPKNDVVQSEDAAQPD